MLRQIFLQSVCLVVVTSPLYAEITWTGEIDPADPTTWTYGTGGKVDVGSIMVTDGSDLYSNWVHLGTQLGVASQIAIIGEASTWTSYGDITVGLYGNGMIAIEGGGIVSSQGGCIGNGAAAMGKLVVNGAGSEWNSTFLELGFDGGEGVLEISNGGLVDVSENLLVASDTSSTGRIQFAEGTLKTTSLYAAPSDLEGTGTIHANAIVSDIDLVFDASHGLQQTLLLSGHADQQISVYLDVDGRGDLGAAYAGTGSLTVSQGVHVVSDLGTVGFKKYSQGTVSVDGEESIWEIKHDVVVGLEGSGEIHIAEGGAVHCSSSHLGYWNGSDGRMVVEGDSSTLKTEYFMCVGYYGVGTLDVLDGGTVASTWGHIGFSGFDAYEPVPSEGHVLVSGAGSKWTNHGELNVGKQGAGSLMVSCGGMVTTYATAIGSGVEVDYQGQILSTSSGMVTVEGEQSQLTTYGPLFVGREGIGRMDITTGGKTSSYLSTIGLEATSQGHVTVEGAGSQWINYSSLVVGQSGNGLLEISSGGTVVSGNPYGLDDGSCDPLACLVGSQSFSSGEIRVQGTGSLWWNYGPVYLGGGNGGEGVLEVKDGGTVVLSDTLNSSGLLSVSPRGQLLLDGGALTVSTLDKSNGGGFTFNNGELSVVGGKFLPANGESIIAGHAEGDLPTLTLQDGASSYTTENWVIGDTYAGATIVDGPGSILSVGGSSKNVNVGRNGGDGTLVISNGATVKAPGNNVVFIGISAGSSGYVTVKNAGSTLLVGEQIAVGINGYSSGEALVLNGGQVLCGGSTYIGKYDGSMGTVAVDGTGSAWDISSGDLFVGNEGEGVMEIRSGGVVLDRHGYIGAESGSSGSVIVEGVGASVTNEYHTHVGYHGTGRLSVANGAVVVNGASGFVGHYTGSVGTVTVDGSDSLWSVARNIYVGDQGHGTLVIVNGGTVTSARCSIGTSSDATGVAVVDGVGSTWINREDFSIGGSFDAASDGAASLEVLNGGSVVINEDLRIWSAGMLTIDGGLVSVGNALSISSSNGDLGGIYMKSGGQLALFGEADSSLADFLDLILEDDDNIRYLSAECGDWSPIIYATYGEDYTLEYVNSGDLEGYTVLTVGTFVLPGDFNGDGLVNQADYTVWRNNLGAIDESAIGYAGDGYAGVNIGDYQVWKSSFGTGVAQNNPSTAVPEPGTSAFGMLCCLAAASHCQRRHLFPVDRSKSPDFCAGPAFRMYSTG